MRVQRCLCGLVLATACGSRLERSDGTESVATSAGCITPLRIKSTDPEKKAASSCLAEQRAAGHHSLLQALPKTAVSGPSAQTRGRRLEPPLAMSPAYRRRQRRYLSELSHREAIWKALSPKRREQRRIALKEKILEGRQ